MPIVSVVVGILLCLEGVGFYLGTGMKSMTALIPVLVGLPILLAGLVAFKPAVRMHAMHVAALAGLLGLLAAVGRMVSAGVTLTTKGTSVLLMAVLCGVFLALCIQSFVAARLRRRRAGDYRE